MNSTNLIIIKGLVVFWVILIIAAALIIDSQNKKKKAQELQLKLLMKKSNDSTSPSIDEDIEKLPYRRKFLLTKNEYWFYKSLKEIADKYDFAVLAKIRFADLVEVSAEADKKEYMKYFGKIKSKHIDFILCKKDNLYPELLIELNDSSHNKEDRIKRDDFIKKIAEKVGYKMVFVGGTQNLEETIIKALEIKSENNNEALIYAN